MAMTWGYWNSSATTSTDYYDASGYGDPWQTWATTSSATSNETWYSWSSETATISQTTASTTDKVVWYTWCDDADLQPDEYVEVTIRQDKTFVAWDGQMESELFKRLNDKILQHYRNNQQEINRIWREHIAEELRLEKEAAENKAKELLLDLVSEKEFEMYEKTGRLLVKGRKHNYLINKSGRIVIVKDEKTVQGMCIHLNSQARNKCPDTDNVIALKLNIEYREKQFLKTANHHGDRPADLDDMKFLKAVNG